MPGLAYNGPFIHRMDDNLKIHSDLFGLEHVDIQWDGLYLPHVQLINVGALPIFPSKHKACWPAQSQSPWLKIKEEQQAKLVSSKLLNESSVRYTSSNDSEHDLQAMVHDFMENDSCEMWENSDSDNGLSPVTKFCDKLLVLISSTESPDRELLADVTMVVLAINEDTDLVHSSETSDCKGSCTRRFVVKHLQSSGYNAALCKSRWPNSGRVPGGEYEFIDVIIEGDRAAKGRLIVDIDFQAQFEIARPTQHYLAALQCLPAIFVGSTAKVEQVLEIMSESAKCSLKQNSMHLPPWRTLEYMSAKWLSPSERSTIDVTQSVQKGPCSFQWRSSIQVPKSLQTKHCGEQLRRTKVSLLAEVKGSTLSVVTHGKGRANLLRKRPPNWWPFYGSPGDGEQILGGNPSTLALKMCIGPVRLA